MTLFAFFIAVFNLAIGFALAWGIQRVGGVGIVDPTSTALLEAVLRQETLAPTTPEPPGAPTPTAREPIPPEWLSLLKRQGVQAGSFVEAALPVFSLKIGAYLEQLAGIEQQVRMASGKSQGQVLQRQTETLLQINDNWLDGQTRAAERLARHGYPNEEFQNAGRDLEDALLDQATQIQIAQTNMDRLDFQTGSDANRPRLLAELLRMIELTHALRDRSVRALTAVFRLENRLEPLPQIEADNAATETPNRLQIEQILEAWQRDGPPGGAAASVAIIDIDRVADLNKQLGVRTVDRVLDAAGKLIEELREIGRQPVARYAGASFLLLLDGAELTDAAAAVERMRRAVEASSFVVDKSERRLTFSGGVAAVRQGLALSELFERLEQTLGAAKQAGRNRTYLDQDAQPAPVPPESDPVEGRVVPVADDEHEEGGRPPADRHGESAGAPRAL